MGSGTQTQGVVMCNQPCTVDVAACVAQFAEDAGHDVLDEVLARLQALFSH